MVKGGRILNFVSGYRRFYSFLRIEVSCYFTTIQHPFDSGYLWSILGHFFEMLKKRAANDDLSEKDFKTYSRTIFENYHYSYRSETTGFFIAALVILKISVSIVATNIIDATNISIPNFISTK